MSGHSKWSNIHRKKEANDKVRSGIFTKMAQAISIAVKKGGGMTDPDQNFALRLAVDKAKAVNMPKENIDRAIAKAGGKGEGAELAELTIEGFAPSGVAFVAEAVTDNRNRTVAELRTMIEKMGGRMGEMGSVSYMFDRRGIVVVRGEELVGDQVLLELIDLGVIDNQNQEIEGEVLTTLVTEPNKLHEVVTKLQNLSFEIEEAKLGYVANTTTDQSSEQVFDFVENVLNHPDVQEVYVNLV